MQSDSSSIDKCITPSQRENISSEDLKFHPDFSSLDANVVLAAKGAQLYFRLHSYTLKTTSGFFRTMYSLPQPLNSLVDIVYLDEDENVLVPLFCMISGFPFPEITSHELLDSLVFAAEKYDMPGPMAFIRMHLLIPSRLTDDIRLYALASRYDWKQERKILSTRTLSLYLYDELHHPSIRTISTDAVLDLFMLHRRRRDEFRKCLDAPPFVSGNPSNCGLCATLTTYSTWKDLKFRMITEMDRRPLGDVMQDGTFGEWPEAIACWRAVCPNDACKRMLYDKSETVRVVRGCIEGLPSTV